MKIVVVNGQAAFFKRMAAFSVGAAASLGKEKFVCFFEFVIHHHCLSLNLGKAIL
ncbi:hypothetical protein [Oceanobacillus massiliensis]|uniref:hypothetical protein n=1 Tax=Oceanobacillus massiliensis TaxID=1465765 RepID=UPI00301AF87E